MIDAPIVSTPDDIFVSEVEQIPRPDSLTVNPEGIPPELRQWPQWVCWWYEYRHGQAKPWTKPCLMARQPFYEGRPRYARANDPTTWADFDTAYETYLSHPGVICGVGFVPSISDPFCFIDLDKCVDLERDHIEQWAMKDVRLFQSYTETSPSGTGLHVIVKAKLPGTGRHYKGREVYDNGHYMTVLGRPLPGYDTPIRDRPQSALHYYTNPEFFPQDKERPQREATGPRAALSVEDERIVSRLLEMDKGRRLWEGDTGDHKGDHSAADLALCSYLAWLCGPDSEDQIDRLFRQSGLMRDKWERPDYSGNTIGKALDRDEEDWFRWPCVSDDWCREMWESGPKVSVEEVTGDTIDPPERPQAAQEQPQAAQEQPQEQEAPQPDQQPQQAPEQPQARQTAQEQAQAQAQQQTDPNAYQFRPLSSREFDAQTYRTEWLVRKILVKDQPGILGGPKKSMKTNLLCDLAISLGTGLPFLEEFETRPSSVCLISGESGEHTIQETARRICRSKGICLADTRCWWEFRLPKLISEDLVSVAKGIYERKIEVVIIDPLYLCLLAGLDGKNAGNLYDMGPLLKMVSDTCLKAGATPILAHHARKNLNNPYQPLDLEDLSFAGVQEFARQWVLVNRRQAYAPGSGIHDLWLSAGGSVGHGGLWGVRVDEGQLQEDFTGRKWDVEVMSLEQTKEVKEKEKALKKEVGQKTEEDSLIDTLRSEGGMTAKKLAEHLGWRKLKFDRVFDKLAKVGIVGTKEGHIECGNGAKRKAKIVVLNDAEHG